MAVVCIYMFHSYILFVLTRLQELVERVKEYGGRFLVKGTDELWYEMTDERARLKASHCKSVRSCYVVLLHCV